MVSEAFTLSPEFDILWRKSAEEVVRTGPPKELRKSVMKLSDFFIRESSAPTPWQEAGAFEAYALYFHPLNYLRARKAIRQAHSRGFFDGLKYFVDWGCGLGALTKALADELPSSITKKLQILGVDQSPKALKGYLHWNSDSFPHLKVATPEQFARMFTGSWDKTCLGLSYSLNELKGFDLLKSSPEALLILEPSTYGWARELQSFRAKALGVDYFAWSPCAHQEACPLLTSSRKDWCFDRLSPALPGLWEELFRDLPIKNKTITFSSMALRKSQPRKGSERLVRLVGDDLREKGKTRWLACAGPEKFFLAWLTKWGEAPGWKRGNLLALSPEMAGLLGGGEVKVPPEMLDHIRHL